MSRGTRGRPGDRPRASPRPAPATGSHGPSRWVLASACLAAAAAACTPPGERPAARASAVAVAYCCGDEVLSPAMDTGARRLVFLPLLTFDDAGGWEGRLARSWAHSDDYREWRYRLRTDVRWHDGRPVTAADVKFTLDLWAHPEVQWYGAHGMEEAVAPDDSTVLVRYREPTDALRYQPWLVYYPKHLLEDLDPAGFYEWDFWKRPVGNGPYRLVSLVPETMMAFEANPDHYAGRPAIRRVILRFSDVAAVRDLLAGRVDAVDDVDPEQAHRLEEDGRFRAYHAYSADVGVAIYWRVAVPPFDDPRVRRALVRAIDRRELLDVLGFPEGTPLTDGPFTERQLRRGEVSAAVPFDPEGARELLEAAGWRDGDGDGIRERTGAPLRFTILTRATGEGERIAVVVQQQLRRVGVDTEVLKLDGSVARERLESGEFEAAIEVTGIPSDWLSRFFGVGNVLGYENPSVAERIARAEATADPDERDGLLAEITEAFRADPPAAFLFPRVHYFVTRRAIRGLSSPWRADPVFHMEELSLAEEGSPTH